MTIELDENDCPQMDGLSIVHFCNEELSPLRFPYKDFSADLNPVGIAVTDKKTRSIKLYPWHNILELQQIANSEDYVMAIQLFRESCKHVFDQEDHQIISAFCHHQCIVCGKVEQLHHDSDSA